MQQLYGIQVNLRHSLREIWVLDEKVDLTATQLKLAVAIRTKCLHQSIPYPTSLRNTKYWKSKIKATKCTQKSLSVRVTKWSNFKNQTFLNIFQNPWHLRVKSNLYLSCNLTETCKMIATRIGMLLDGLWKKIYSISSFTHFLIVIKSPSPYPYGFSKLWHPYGFSKFW